ncbi:unnamed protein product [Trichobilharzia regenti]|nr:unnamed protein product [Trichobilharzia regenti]
MEINGFRKVNRLLELTASNLYSLRRIVDTITCQSHGLTESNNKDVTEDIHNLPLSNIKESPDSKHFITPAKKRAKTESV